MIYINEVPAFWSKVLGVDLETTDLDPHVGKILSVTISDGVDVYIFLHFNKFDGIKDVLEDDKVVKIFHNAKFDISWIKGHLGWEVRNIYDTFLAEQVLIAARDMGASLADVIAQRIGEYVDKGVRETFYNHPGFHVRPITQDQIDYMAGDVVFLPKIRELQLQEAEENSCVWPIEIENRAVSAYAEIELSGFNLDVDKWYEFSARFAEERLASEQRLREMLGPDYVLRFMNKSVKNPKEKVISVAEVNFGSPDQVKRISREHYGLEIENTNEKYLEEFLDSIDPEHPGARFLNELLNLRHWKKAAGWDYPKFVHPKTGKVHPNYHQIGTDTGRSSVSDPNMQQVSRPDTVAKYSDLPEDKVPNLRHLWTADRPELVLLRADYSQQEIRVLASVSKDVDMLKACNSADVYLEVGRLMYSREIKKGDPERQEAKIFALATGYRSGVGRLRRASKLPEKRCKEIRDTIRKRFPKMVQYGEQAESFAKRNSYVMTLTGRRRYFNAKSKIYTEAVNTVVQGTSLDMIKIALGSIYWDLTELKKAGKISSNTRIWHMVHDEIVVQCHKDEIETVLPIVTSRMEEAGRTLCPDVLHLAEAKYSYTWDK